MKKMVAILISGVAFSAASFAQTNVSSANVVGYNQITIPTNQIVLIATSFLNASNTIAGLFPDLPAGSKISIWNPTLQKYNSFAKGRTSWGATDGTNTIPRGRGVFISLPAGVGTNLYVSGDVPQDSTSTVYKVAGLALMSYPYPADVAFTNTALAQSASPGDKISFWNNGWVGYSRGRTSWTVPTNLQLRVGQGFFYQSATNAAVNEVQPYTIN